VFHFHFVGHFDPRDPVDTSAKPHTPKARSPISREAVERVLAACGPEVAKYIEYDDAGGYVTCCWSHAPSRLWGEIHRFAVALAQAEGAVVMNEPPAWPIEYPERARQLQEALWADEGQFFWAEQDA